jgi:hypothetical protein
MRLEINRLEGLRNDLSLRLEQREIASVLLSVANRDRLQRLPGMPRHRKPTADEEAGIQDAKMPIERHLAALGIVDAEGVAVSRAVAISNRNLGANHGFVACQRTATPRVFRVADDPVDYGTHSCLVVWRAGRVSIEDLRFDIKSDRVFDAEDGRDLSDEIEWATFGQRVLRQSRVTPIDELLHQFYDIRHALA